MSVKLWLQSINLEQYLDTLESGGYGTLEQCSRLTDEMLEELGITLLGHKKRILAYLPKPETISDMDEHLYGNVPLPGDSEPVKPPKKDFDSEVPPPPKADGHITGVSSPRDKMYVNTPQASNGEYVNVPPGAAARSDDTPVPLKEILGKLTCLVILHDDDVLLSRSIYSV